MLVLAPNNNRGMTYQTDEKYLINLLEYIVRVIKFAIYC
jgi:hypothetical protein